jgi:DNA-directed RNA polymerase
LNINDGVSGYGMKDQITDELNHRKVGNIKYLDAVDEQTASVYLGIKLQDAIDQTVVAANSIKIWLQSCAKIFNSLNLPIKWTTPTGFICNQSYDKVAKTFIRTYWGKASICNIVYEPGSKLNTKRQTSGISPNVIHSLDASHCTFAINDMTDQGITDMSMIHDSFGCHASNVDAMNAILREQFINIYSHNVVQNLYDQFTSQLPAGTVLPTPPKRGDLNINAVRKSEYFFA